jgi:hypothetical protein
VKSLSMDGWNLNVGNKNEIFGRHSLAEIAHDYAQECLQAGDRQKAGEFARAFQMLSRVIAALRP